METAKQILYDVQRLTFNVESYFDLVRAKYSVAETEVEREKYIGLMKSAALINKTITQYRDAMLLRQTKKAARLLESIQVQIEFLKISSCPV